MNSASTPRSVLSRRSDLLQPQKSATVAPTGRPAAMTGSAPVFRDALILARLSIPCPRSGNGFTQSLPMIMPLMLTAVRSFPREIRSPVLTAAFRAPEASPVRKCQRPDLRSQT